MRTIRRVPSRLFSLALPLLLGSSLALGVGCNNKERAVPPGPPPLPGLKADATATAPSVGSSAMHAMPGDHPATLEGHSAPTAAPPPAAASPGSEGNIMGSIKISDKVKDKVQPGATLFLVARAALEGGKGAGPVLAARKLTVSAFPLSFELSQSDVMIDGVKLGGKVVLTARVDQDGDAMTKQPGDVEGVTPPLSVPAQGVELLLDTVRSEAAGGPSPAGMGGMGAAPSMPAGHPALPAGHPKP